MIASEARNPEYAEAIRYRLAGPAEPAPKAPVGTLEQARSDAEGRYLRALLLEFRGNISQAARIAGVSRMTLYRLMDKHGLRGGE
jgi:transcriptional regulator of acetoin/glycerol metabolism